MYNNFVNKKSIIEGIKVTPELTARQLREYTGRDSITYEADSIKIKLESGECTCKYGDILAKNAKGDIWSVPCDLFNNQYAPVVAPEEPVFVAAKWLASNPRSVLMQLDGHLSNIVVDDNLCLILPNLLRVPIGHYAVYNTKTGSWAVLDTTTFNALFRG